MSARVRSRPQLLQHEQEDQYLHTLEASALLAALSQSLQPDISDSSDSSGVTTDSEAEDGFFSSTELCKQLYSRGFLAVATTRYWVSGFPKALVHINRSLGEG